MRIQHLGAVLPVADLGLAVRSWSTLLDAAPKFVDQDRWAQFELAGCRLALAGTDRQSDAAGVMVKVDDLAQARRRAQDLGLELGETSEGAHETRFTAIGPGGWPILFYAPRA